MARFVAYSLSLVCACLAVWLFLQYRAITSQQIRATAETVNIDKRSTEGPGGVLRRSYHLIVRFPLEDGTQKTVMLQEALPSLRMPGKEVVVLYPPEQPELAQTQSGLAALWPTWLAAGMALAAFAAGIVFHREDKRRVPTTQGDTVKRVH